MKKIILTTSFILLACFVSNNTATAGCEQALIGQLRGCIASSQSTARVVVKNGFVYIDGDSSGPGAAGCIAAYNSGSASCPAALQLVGGDSGGLTVYSF